MLGIRFNPSVYRRLGLPARLLLCLLTAVLGVLLACPGSAFGATTVTEQHFSASLLTALSHQLPKPLDLPLSTDDPAFKITALDLTNQNIQNLKGIEYFTELNRLTLDYNKLTSLSDVKFPESLRYLSLAHNALSRVDENRWPSQLRQLDLRNNRLTSPLGIALPNTVTLLQLDNNFLKSKITGPAGRQVTYDGNFIYEAGKIRPASLMVKDNPSLALSPGNQVALPFVTILSSTNPNNAVPPSLFTASLSENNGCLTLDRQEYRFLLTAKTAGSDSLTIRLDLTDYMIQQFDRMNQTFYQVEIPITVWQSANDRNQTKVGDSGDWVVAKALSGRSNHAVLDMSRFPKGQVSFSPGLLAQLAAKNKSLILSQNFGSLTLDSLVLQSLTKQASLDSQSAIVLAFSPYPQRPNGYGPSRFSAKEISSLAYPDFNFEALLQLPGKGLQDLTITAPVKVTLFLEAQDFSTWDFNHLTAFKDEDNQLLLLGGDYQGDSGNFTYLLNSGGRYGLGTRGKQVQWLDLALNSATLSLSDGSSQTLNPPPLLYKGNAMVPARAIFETLGAHVRWNDSTQGTTLSYGNRTFYIQADSFIGNTDLKPYLSKGRMLLPLRYFSDEIGANVLWWANGGKIRIIY